LKNPRISFKIHPPIQTSRGQTLVFVHGMAHGGWCWERFWVPWFNARGYHCVTLDLRGHGASEGWEKLRITSIKDFTNDVRQVLSQVEGLPILIGHSMGGFIIQKMILSKIPMKAAVTIASVPASGFGKGLLKLISYDQVRFIKGLITLSTTPFSDSPSIVRKLCFSSEAPEDLVNSTFMAMQPESFRAFLEMVFLNLHKPVKSDIPCLFLAAGRDAVVDNEALKKTADGFGASFVLLQNLAHDMMLDVHWEDPCRVIHEWLNTLL